MEIEKVIKGLECCIDSNCSSCPPECPYMKRCFTGDTQKNMYIHLLEDALAMIRAQQKRIEELEAGQQWISAKDRPPEDESPVLVWESQGFAYVDNFINGDWYLGKQSMAIVTHWMPIPEPPKEDGK